MNFSIYRISLDIHKTASQLSFSARQGDTSRRLYISLVENGAPYVISEECYAVFAARKPDGSVIFNDCTIQDNMIIYDMTEQTTALTGRCECEVSLYGYDNDMISSPRFAYTVYPSVGAEDGVVSTDEVTALRTLITEANGAIGRANKVTDEVEEKLANGDFIGDPGNSMVYRFSAYRDGKDFSATWHPGKIYMGIASVPHDEPAPTNKEAYDWTLFATNILELIPVTLSASAWSNGEQSIETMLIDESALFPSPKDQADMDAWIENDLRLDRATVDSMTFTCKKTPTVDIVVNVLVMQPMTYALPPVTKADAGKCLVVDENGKLSASSDLMDLMDFLRLFEEGRYDELPPVTKADAGKCLQVDENGNWQVVENDIFVIKLNADGTALANTTWVDIGAALYNGKTLELRYYDANKAYRSCSYIYNTANPTAGIHDNELLFFVPYAEHGNGYTFPGRKIVKITNSGVTVKTEKFNISM